MNLQAKTGIQPIGQHPLHQFARIEHAILRAAHDRRRLGECGREQHAARASLKSVLTDEVSGKFIIAAIGDDELDLVTFRQEMSEFA